MGVDDVTVDLSVDLGEIPIEHARVLLMAIQASVRGGQSWWQPENYQRACALEALLSYRIAKAEKTASWAEPA